MSLKIATKTGASWNPWIGCRKVSKECVNCFFFRDLKKFHPDWDPTTVRRSKTMFDAPLKWKEPQLIFTPSWPDWWIEEADAWREEAWDIIRRTPWHTYRICTKRVERIADHLPADWGAGYRNVWLGCSVGAQDYVWRMDVLRGIPATLRWVSAEPLLGPLKLDLTGFKFLVSGGESGPKPRPANLDWFRDLRDQCAVAGVYFLHKQHGGSKKCKCKKTAIPGSVQDHEPSWGCRVLDGKLHDEIPPW